MRSCRSATASRVSCTSPRCRTHHVDSPEQVVTPGEELWVKIIDLDLARRRISLSIKQAAEGGELAEEYREHFEIDEHGNWTAGDDDAEREAAWSEYYGEDGPPADEAEGGAVAEGAVAEADARRAASRRRAGRGRRRVDADVAGADELEPSADSRTADRLT